MNITMNVGCYRRLISQLCLPSSVNPYRLGVINDELAELVKSTPRMELAMSIKQDNMRDTQGYKKKYIITVEGESSMRLLITTLSDTRIAGEYPVGVKELRELIEKQWHQQRG